MIGVRLSRTIREFKDPNRAFLIAEIKAKSPESGNLIGDREPEKLAGRMVDAGAEAISVVTEPDHFGGDFDMLREVRRAVDVPLLAKDFVDSLEQIKKAKSYGADSVLLISSTLSTDRLKDLHTACLRMDIEPLVETHTSQEIRSAKESNAQLVGINNRDITQLEMDSGGVERTELLAEQVRENQLIVSESSIKSKRDVQRAVGAGADAVLVGTAILKADNLEEKIRELVNYGMG